MGPGGPILLTMNTEQLTAEADRLTSLARAAWHKDQGSAETMALVEQARKANQVAHAARCADYKARMAAK